MEEKLVETIFGIITYAGEAKFQAKEAIQQAKKGEFEAAREHIKTAEETIVSAHKHQTELITKEANGEKVETSVLLIHSQDHLMSSMDYIEIAKEFIDMYESR